MHYIEPENRRQASLFSSLDDFVAGDNPVRLLDLIVEEVVGANPEKFLRRGLRNVGRKAYSPQVLLKLFLYGYLHGISSSRKLEAETKRNMELMWLLGRLSPDHKTISDYRKNHSEAIHFLALRFREYLIDANYITGRKVALDGTKLKANAARQKFFSSKSLERRLRSCEAQLNAYLDQLGRNDVLEDARDEDDESGGGVNQALIDKICELEEEIIQLKSVEEQLERHSQDKISMTDPECRMMKSSQGFIPGYNLQVVTDMAMGMIAHAEIRQEPSDYGLAEEMIDNLEAETSIVPEEFHADKAYYSPQQLHWLEIDRGITSWIPVPEQKQKKRDRKAGIEFVYQPKTDSYLCSQGQPLLRYCRDLFKQGVIYKSKTCGGCSKKPQCTPGANRSLKEPFLKKWMDAFRQRMSSNLGRKAIRDRSAWAEHPFGTLKNWMGKQQLKMRGKVNVQTEIDLYATAYNFKRLLNITSHDQIKSQVQSYNWIGS